MVRQRSATPLSPVQIWLAPELKSSENLGESRLSGFFLLKNIVYNSHKSLGEINIEDVKRQSVNNGEMD